MWQELLQTQQTSSAEGTPAQTFALDGSVFRASQILRDLVASRTSNFDTCKLKDKDGKFRVAAAWWRLVWQESCSEVCRRFGPERRRLPMPEVQRATCEVLRADLQEQLVALSEDKDHHARQALKEKLALVEQLADLAAQQDYGAAAKVQMKLQPIFDFSMEELYRTLFQAEESVQRERQLHALFDSLASYQALHE